MQWVLRFFKIQGRDRLSTSCWFGALRLHPCEEVFFLDVIAAATRRFISNSPLVSAVYQPLHGTPKVRATPVHMRLNPDRWTSSFAWHLHAKLQWLKCKCFSYLYPNKHIIVSIVSVDTDTVNSSKIWNKRNKKLLQKMFTAWNLLDLLALRSPNGSIPRNGDVCPCIPCTSSGDVSTYGGPQSFWMFILHRAAKENIGPCQNPSFKNQIGYTVPEYESTPSQEPFLLIIREQRPKRPVTPSTVAPSHLVQP